MATLQEFIAIRRTRATWLVLLVLTGGLAAMSLRPAPVARADVREITPKEHFKSGGERAVIVLEEISATLKQMDARLMRIEDLLATAHESPPGSPPVSAESRGAKPEVLP